ncbi:hypothetical protein S40288_06384 [Stachybotrys chartarum IBT 40288]|nr:hypothetical protein S40288_06384 [Stachybotrys chartarum IBT 40288]
MSISMLSELSSGSSNASGHPNLDIVSDDLMEGSDTSFFEGLNDHDEGALSTRQCLGPGKLLCELYEENITAKVCRTASKFLLEIRTGEQTILTPTGFPEIVPQEGPQSGQYQLREPEFWTCGFFPGTLYALLERSIKYPQKMQFQESNHAVTLEQARSQLRILCQTWSAPIHDMSGRTNTHDIGFIIMPALKRDWELNSSERSLASIMKAADSLASRYVSSAGAIRSWDILLKKEITVTDMTENLLVIIDSMCNLDLLFYAAAQSGDGTLATMAETHARTLLTTHLREEYPWLAPKRKYTGKLYSTCHLANISPADGVLKWRWTAQGYSNESTWARGQSWAVLGYAQTYMWTKDQDFLDAACGTAEYFLYRLETSPKCVEVPIKDTDGEVIGSKGRYVPLWDFDAPIDTLNPLRDSSSGIIAANGMLILSQALQALGNGTLAAHFLDTAIKIVRDTLDLSLASEKAAFVGYSADGDIEVADELSGSTFDAILKHGTANNNENARRRYANHGLVYGDYYLVEFGNRLLSTGLV